MNQARVREYILANYSGAQQERLLLLLEERIKKESEMDGAGNINKISG